MNNSVSAVLGYSPADIQKMGAELLRALVRPDDYPAVLEHMKRMSAAGDDDVIEYEYRMKHANGEWRWLHSRDVVFTRSDDGTVRQILGTAQDITGRKRTEEQLRVYRRALRSLGSELALAEERERRRIAVDLHDRIGQSLAVSALRLEALKGSAPSGEFANTLDEVCGILERTIRDTRSLTFELSSPVLYELGFVPAVEWLAGQFAEQHGLRVEVEDDGQDKPMDEDVRVLLFRAVRELLTNVARHARAACAKVSIELKNDEIRITVEDNGVGFDASTFDPYGSRMTGFGLFSIRERLDFLGGSFQVKSEHGRGTRVVMAAPLRRDREGVEEGEA